ncbi:MAG: MBL fold metallo-hydrolase [Pseudomonadota bacterium]
MSDQSAEASSGSTPSFQVQLVQVTPFQQNCSIVRAPSGAAVVIDPGGEVDRIMAVAKQMDADIKKVWLTHGHVDHAGGAEEIKRRTGAPIEGPHKEDVFWLDQIEAIGKQYGIEVGDNCKPDRFLDEGDTLEIDGIRFEVYFTPGHAPGHVIFFQRDKNLAFVGDVLFAGSIGRTDFPLCDHDALIRSVTDKLWPLGEDVRFVPGHGEMSTFAAERKTNPFVADHITGYRSPSES